MRSCADAMSLEMTLAEADFLKCNACFHAGSPVRRYETATVAFRSSSRSTNDSDPRLMSIGFDEQLTSGDGICVHRRSRRCLTASAAPLCASRRWCLSLVGRGVPRSPAARTMSRSKRGRGLIGVPTHCAVPCRSRCHPTAFNCCPAPVQGPVPAHGQHQSHAQLHGRRAWQSADRRPAAAERRRHPVARPDRRSR